METIGPPSYRAGNESDLSFDDLCSRLLEYQATLFDSRFTVVWGSELWLWSWTTEVLAGVPLVNDQREPNTMRLTDHRDIENPVAHLLRLVCRIALADIPTSDGKEGFEERMARSEALEPNAREMIREKVSVLAYMSFPLLEGVTKLRCSQFVELDGTALARFVPPKGRAYDPSDKSPRRYSSLHDLLWLLQQKVADSSERATLDSFRAALSVAEPAVHPYQLIYNWRNSTLHGADLLQRVGYSVYNLALLVGLHGVRDRYEAIRVEVSGLLDEMQERDAMMGWAPSFTPWHFYPPHSGPPTRNILHHFQTGR